jgi:hypothetical protein
MITKESSKIIRNAQPEEDRSDSAGHSQLAETATGTSEGD